LSQSVDTVAKLSYENKVGSISAENKTKYSKDISLFEMSSVTKALTRGGTTSAAGQLPTDMTAWADSVPKQAVMVDFVDSNSLIGIWQLAADPNRRNQIHDAYAAFCNANQYKFNLQNGPFLEFRKVPLLNVPWSDHGSGAAKDISVGRPDKLDSGWYYLAPIAYGGTEGGHYNQPTGTITVVREIVPGILQDITDWEPVYDNRGAGSKKPWFSMWRGTTGDPNFKVLGDFFRGPVPDNGKPTAADTAGLKAVHSICLTQGAIGNQIWNDQGSHANMWGSAWEIVAHGGGEAERAFVANGAFNTSGWDKPTNRELWVLSTSPTIVTGH